MDRRRKHDRKRVAAAAEIGELPPVESWGRRRACGLSLTLFGVTYFPDTVGQNFLSEAHHRVGERMESSILRGGRVLNAVFRGFAKTTWSEIAALWATFYGYRKYVLLLGNINDAADQMLDSIRMELEGNDYLAADFPEICLPFHNLEGKSQRCRSQTYEGESTYIEMKTGKLVLPWIPGPAQGAVIRSSGFAPPRRGMKHKRPDGSDARPDLAIIDDFQTDDSARNPDQVRKILYSYMYKTVFGSSGHGSKMAAVVNATPIEPDDGVEQLLDHNLNPTFSSERIPMVQSWSVVHDTLWEEYRKILFNFDPADEASKAAAERAATAFYLANRTEMDAGCIVCWPHIPLAPGVHSAIQHAYNKLFELGPDVFASEFQMNPSSKRPDGVDPHTAAEISVRFNGYKRRQIPEDAAVVTCGVDVHKDVLFWSRIAWTQLCQGWIVDYGTFPEQPNRFFTKRSAKRTLEGRYPGKPPEEAITLGLQELLAQLQTHRCDRILVDRGYHPEEVSLAIRTAQNPQLIMPSLGVGKRADQIQINDYKRRKGYLIGDNWYRHAGVITFDTHNFKTWLHQRWGQPITGLGLSLFGAVGEDHRLFAEHMVAEVPKLESAPISGSTKIVWENTRRVDNHWLDTVVMSAVAAYMEGCSITGFAPAKEQGDRRAKLIEMAHRKAQE